MAQIFAALVPVFLIIALGGLLKRRRLLDQSVWDGVEQLTFYLLLPALLIVKIGGAEVPGTDMLPLFATLFAVTALVCGVVLVLRPGVAWDGPVFASVAQGMVRPNSYVGLAAAYALYGDAGLTLAAVCLLAVLPLVNLYSVYVHYRWVSGASDEAAPVAKAARESLRNPIFVGCLVGAFLNLSGFGLPPLVGEVLTILGQAALALGLLAVGAGLELRALRVAGLPAATSVAVKLAVLPVLAVIASGLFGVSGLAVSIAVLFAALPVAPSSFIMARQLGGDGELMAAIVALSTLLAMATLPLVVWSLGP